VLIDDALKPERRRGWRVSLPCNGHIIEGLHEQVYLPGEIPDPSRAWSVLCDPSESDTRALRAALSRVRVMQVTRHWRAN
jgi:hypothetical protein